MKKTASFSEQIKQSGLKLTKQRCAILEILMDCGNPLAAEQIFTLLAMKGFDINLSTVYRSLEAMAEKDLIIKLSITGDNRILFEYNTKKHRHYLVCLCCKKIIAIEHCPLEDYEEKLARLTDYQIAGHRLDVYGYCPECRKNL